MMPKFAGLKKCFLVDVKRGRGAGSRELGERRLNPSASSLSEEGGEKIPDDEDISDFVKINLDAIALTDASTIVVQWSARSNKLNPKEVIRGLRMFIFKGVSA
jgi:hypothetical protein